MTDKSIPRIALVGANGYGLHHRHNLEPRRQSGEIAFAGMCDTAEIFEDADIPVGDIPVFDDYQKMLDETDPDVVIIATPPPTHLPIASAAMRHGADVYLEKPPVSNLEEYKRLYEVMVETGGHRDVSVMPAGTVLIVDMKTPSSGESHKMLWSNLQRLGARDAVKFVVGDQADYDWSKELIARHRLESRCQLLMSPSHAQLPASELVAWMLRDRLKARLNLQVHKYVWPPEMRGV